MKNNKDMKPQKDWTDALRDRLKDAQMTPPANGWERLAEPHPIPPLKGREPSRPSFRRGKGKTTLWLAAAAAMLAAVLIIDPFGKTHHESLRNDVTLADAKSPMEPERLEGKDGQNELDGLENQKSLAKLDNLDKLDKLEKLDRLARLEKTGKPAIQEEAFATKTENSEFSENSDFSNNSEISEKSEHSEHYEISKVSKVSEHSDKPAATQATQAAKATQTTTTVAATDRWLADARRNSSSASRTTADASRFTIGIRNAGSSGGTTTIRPGALAVTNGSYYYSYRPAAAPSLRANTLASNPYATIGDYVFKHNPELSLGLMAAYEPIDRIILESGLTWSVLSSQVVTPANTREQRIQYLGLPVYVGWRFIEHGAFSFTASAGATVEHLLNARLGSWKQEERPWQFAVGGQLGFRYDLGHHSGLAFEPSVNYHLTETYNTTSRTDHPLALSLRLILQYNL